MHHGNNGSNEQFEMQRFMRIVEYSMRPIGRKPDQGKALITAHGSIVAAKLIQAKWISGL